MRAEGCEGRADVFVALHDANCQPKKRTYEDGAIRALAFGSVNFQLRKEFNDSFPARASNDPKRDLLMPEEAVRAAEHVVDVAAVDEGDLDNHQDDVVEVIDEAGSSSRSSSSGGGSGGSHEGSSANEDDDKDCGDGKGLASSDLIAEMDRYRHAELTAADEEALHQAFALLHGAALAVDRQEDLMAWDIRNYRRQASEAS
ncbi:hypothetical protein ABZP36_021680 [Zizania latifolia]